MPSTYSNIKIQLMGTGENSTTWGDVTNVNLGTALEEAIVASSDVTFASANVTLTLTNTNATQVARHLRLRCTGTTGGARDLIVPSIEKPYIVRNDCADTITVKTAAGTGIAVPAGRTMWVYGDGTNVVDAVTHLSSLTLTTALPVLQGGTGSNTAGGARTNLGATTVGGNLFTLANPSAITFPRINADNSVSTLDAATFRTAIGATTVGVNLYTLANPSAVTFPRFNADNTVSALDAATFRGAIGAGTGSGSVTSVGMTVPAFLSVTPASITTSGTFAVTLSGTALPIANGGTGSTVTAYCNLTTNVTGTLPIANGGTGSTSTTYCSLTTNVTGTLPITNGGTGATSAGAALTALGAYPATNPNGYTSNTGTVTSVGMTVPAFLSVTPASITTSGTFAVSLSGTALPIANGGTGSTSTAYCSLTTNVTGTLPIANGGTGSTATAYCSLTANVTGTLPVANGGTGATTLTGVVIGNGASAFTTVTAPSGAIVGTTDTQNLSNKTLTTGNILDAGTSVSDTGTIAANSPGFRGLPQNGRTASYTLALTDAGKDIYISGTTAAQTITIPANGSVVFPVGSMIQITNDSNQSWSIAITTDTLLWSPNNATGTRTLAAAGQATLRKVTSTRWWISGAGIT